MIFTDLIHQARCDLFPQRVRAVKPQTAVPATDCNSVKNGDEKLVYPSFQHFALIAAKWIATRPRSWLGTLGEWFYAIALVFNIAVPVLAVTLISNLRVSMVEWHKQQILKDRDARRLTIQRSHDTKLGIDGLQKIIKDQDAPGRGVGFFAEVEADYLRHSLKEKHGLSFQPAGVFGYREYSPTIEKANQLNSSTTTRWNQLVHTVSTEDTVLSELQYAWRANPEQAMPFTGDGIGQVLVSEARAHDLGIPLEPPQKGAGPVFVDFYYKPQLQTVANVKADVAKRTEVGFDAVEQLEVVGIYHGDAATTLGDLIMTHPFITAVANGSWYKTSSSYHSNALWGPLPDGFDLPRFLTSFEGMMKAKGITTNGQPISVDGKRWLNLVRQQESGPMKQKSWRDFSHRILSNWATLTGEATPPAWEMRFPTSTALVANNSAIQFDKIDIEVNSLEELVELAQLIEGHYDGDGILTDGLGLHILQEERVKSANRVIAQDKAWQGVQGIVIGVTCLLAIMALALALTQRIYQKTSEIGILRAFGASRGLIQSILMVQTSILWFISAILCTFMAPIAYAFSIPIFIRMTDTSGNVGPQGASFAAEGIFEGWTQRLHDFRFDLLAGWSLYGLGIALVATFIASSLAARIIPAKALKVR